MQWAKQVILSRAGLIGITAAVIVLLMVTIGVGLAQNAGKSSNAGGTEGPLLLPATERAKRFQSGSPWQGQGKHGISQQEAESFTDYPTFWLGEQFAGYNLQQIIHNKYTPKPPIPAYEAMDSVTFIYGDCTIPDGYTSCPVPITVAIEPVCRRPPEIIADRVKAGPLETVRGGAQLQRFGDGHVRLWTGEVSVYLEASADPALVDRMVEELRGMNAINGTLEAGAPLPAPDFNGCPPVETSPLHGGPPQS